MIIKIHFDNFFVIKSSIFIKNNSTKPCCLYNKFIAAVSSHLELFKDLLAKIKIDVFDIQKTAINTFNSELQILDKTFHLLAKHFFHDPSHLAISENHDLETLKRIKSRRDLMTFLSDPISAFQQKTPSIDLQPITIFKSKLYLPINKFNRISDRILVLVFKHQMRFHKSVNLKKDDLNEIKHFKYGNIEYDLDHLIKIPLICRQLSITRDKDANIFALHSEIFNLILKGELYEPFQPYRNTNRSFKCSRKNLYVLTTNR